MTQPHTLAAIGHLSRVTLAGPRRRIDLVLPADEPIGLLLPEVVGMVGHPPMDDSRGYQISTLDGTVLDRPPAGTWRIREPLRTAGGRCCGWTGGLVSWLGAIPCRSSSYPEPGSAHRSSRAPS
jgi:hypothetical protein